LETFYFGNAMSRALFTNTRNTYGSIQTAPWLREFVK